MSFKVLLADDNITAQRLGSKILTEAGYEVIAVSNGAAAVKKFAAEKPGLLILDVYMPGYTGLEVCEKVKQDPANASVPVILTATNMEPFNQADGHRVGADAFMVKPFEASDLLAVVQKFESRIKPASEPAYARTTKMPAVEEFKDASYEEWKSEAVEETGAAPAKVEVPHEMAAAPALGMDDYTSPAPEAPAFAIEPAQPAFGEAEAQAPAHPQPMPFEMPEAAAAAPAPLEMPSLGVAPGTPFPSLETSSPEPAAEIASPAEFEPTSAPLTPGLQVATAPELETTAAESTNALIDHDPGLITDADEMAKFATGFGVEGGEEIPVGVAMPEEAAETPAIELTAPPVVEESTPAPDEQPPAYVRTQKLDAYGEPMHAEESGAAAEPSTAQEVQLVAVEHTPEVETEMQRAFAVGSSGAAAAPALEPVPEPAPQSALSDGIPEHLVAQFAAELDQAHQEREAQGEAAPLAEEPHAIEASMEPAPEIPASQLDEERIAVAVNRALEKYKDGLRAELIATIMRELKG